MVEVNHKVKDPMKAKHIDFSRLNRRRCLIEINNRLVNSLRQNGWQGRTGGASKRVGHGGNIRGQTKRRSDRLQTGLAADGVDGPRRTDKTCAICQRSV